MNETNQIKSHQLRFLQKVHYCTVNAVTDTPVEGEEVYPYPSPADYGSGGSVVSSPSGVLKKGFECILTLKKNTSGDNKLVFVCLEIPWNIGTIMVSDQTPGVCFGEGGPAPTSLPPVYTTVTVSQ